MSHVKLVNGVVENYNYKLADLLNENPNTSFPKGWQEDEQLLASYGVYKHHMGSEPSYNKDLEYIRYKDLPDLVNGKWTFQYEIIPYTAREISDMEAEALARKEDFIRTERNKFLKATDWTQVADAPVDQAAWATYRQALRDITKQTNFPNEVDWPTKP